MRADGRQLRRQAMAGLMGLSRGGFCATRRLMMAMSTPGGMPPNGFRADNGVKDCTGLTGIAVNQNARAELIGTPALRFARLHWALG